MDVEIKAVTKEVYRSYRDVRGPDRFASISPIGSPAKRPALSLEGYPAFDGQEAKLFYIIDGISNISYAVVTGEPAAPWKAWLKERVGSLSFLAQYSWGARDPKVDAVGEGYDGLVNIVQQLFFEVDGESWSPVEYVFKEAVDYSVARKWVDEEGSLILAETELLPGESKRAVFTIVRVA